MISRQIISKKVVFKNYKGKVRHIKTENGWACQCIKDCTCNEDWHKANPHLADPQEWFRVDCRWDNPRPNKFKDLDSAVNWLKRQKNPKHKSYGN